MKHSQRLLYAVRKGCWKKMFFKTKNAALSFAARHGYHKQRAYLCPYGCGGFHLTTKERGW